MYRYRPFGICSVVTGFYDRCELRDHLGFVVSDAGLYSAVEAAPTSGVTYVDERAGCAPMHT